MFFLQFPCFNNPGCTHFISLNFLWECFFIQKGFSSFLKRNLSFWCHIEGVCYDLDEVGICRRHSCIWINGLFGPFDLKMGVFEILLLIVISFFLGNFYLFPWRLINCFSQFSSNLDQVAVLSICMKTKAFHL